jgi:hypothetical protein
LLLFRKSAVSTTATSGALPENGGEQRLSGEEVRRYKAFPRI